MVVKPKKANKPTKAERTREAVKAHDARVADFNAKNANDITRLQFRVNSLETLIVELL